MGEGKEGAHDSEILLCEALVSETVWKQVQAILRGREKRKAAPTANEAPLFAGMLWCGCGKRLHFHPDSGRGDCNECNECDVRVSHTEIEGVFAVDFFELVSSIPQLIGALCQPSEFRNLAGEVAELQHQLDSARAKQALAEKLLGESSITSRRFDEIHGPIEEEIRAAELHLTKLKAKLSNQPQPSPRISPDEWQRQWAAWPTSRRRQIVQAFVERITVRPGEIEIAYLLSDSSSKETSPVQQISHPTFQTHPGQPTYIRLPKPGEKCPITGLSRAKLNELILPNERNENNPPVASKSLRQKGAQRGIRLVLLESLLAYLLGKS